MINQNFINDLIFNTVAEAEAAGRPKEICYVYETNRFYSFVVTGSVYTVDHIAVLSTGRGGNTRWVRSTFPLPEPAAGDAGKFWVVNGANSVVLKTRSPKGYSYGCKLIYNSASVINVAVGFLRNSDDTEDIDVTTPVSINLTAVGANGRDTGSEAANTWYAAHIIWQPDGTVAGLASLSSTTPALPSGYTNFRFVQWFKNDNSSNIIKTTVIALGEKKRIIYDDYINVLNGGSQESFTDVNLSAVCSPSAIAVDLIITVTCGLLSNSQQTFVRRNGSSAANGSLMVQNGGGQYTTGSGAGLCPVDNNRIIEYKTTGYATSVFVTGYWE